MTPPKSNLNRSTFKAVPDKPDKPDRATVIRDLTKLQQELEAARSMDSPNREDICRRRIDKKLEELTRCMDPSTASVEEYGRGGTAPT